jgi:hypothetical protein
MATNPVDGSARDRLRQEQAAEVAALRAVRRAQEARAKQQQRVARAEAHLAEAMVDLVRVSGAGRAARLTGETTTVVRQMAREGRLTRDEIQ